MTRSIAWARNPLHSRLHKLDPNIPMSLIYGSESWVDHIPVQEVLDKRASQLVYAHVRKRTVLILFENSARIVVK